MRSGGKVAEKVSTRARMWVVKRVKKKVEKTVATKEWQWAGCERGERSLI